MIDDLVTRGVSEPYRMFTSRAEFRLSLRADNADQRLTAFGRRAGCVGDERFRAFDEKARALAHGKAALDSVSFTPTEAAARGIAVNPDGQRRSAFALLSMAGVQFSDLVAAAPELGLIEPEAAEQLGRDALYANYVGRQSAEVEAIRRDEAWELPLDFDYRALSGLSTELKQKLSAARPMTIGQAARVDGVTPAALTLLLARLRQHKREQIGMNSRSGRDAFQQHTDVSRETLARLDHYEALLHKWNPTINLVSKTTLEELWRRHILDSAQVFALAAPKGGLWVDLGSGGGFPGLVVAILASERATDLEVTACRKRRPKGDLSGDRGARNWCSRKGSSRAN